MDNKSGDIVWKLENNTETNEKYKEIKLNLQRVIKQAHDLLYSNCSIVGVKAQNDIMRVLVLVIMKPYFNDENSEIYQMCLSNKDKVVGFNKYMPYCKDLSLIAKEENPLNKWATFVKKFLIHIFPAVYYEDDAKFNFTDDITFMNLINIINTLEINDDFIDAFASTCGDIHESFRAYGGGKGAKELGQFFTPRHLIHLIFHGLGLQDIMKEMNDVSIYDCCMGTGAFLARMYSLGDVKPENIYGCETEQDTIKFGEASMLLTTKSICKNIVKCDSLCENPFIHTKKMKMIVTNPPFGTKMKYKDLQKKYEDKFKDSSVKFKEIYPVEVNNGACLFIQHCVYMLDEGGVCAIVLPDGELFDGNGKWPKAFRKWWCETVNIIKILKVPSGTFEHTGIKTNVVIFVKNGPTQNIQFLQTNKECDVVTFEISIPFSKIQEKDYTFDIRSYVEDSIIAYNSNIAMLGELIEFIGGKRRKTSEANDDGIYTFVTCSVQGTSKINERDFKEQAIIINAINGAGKCRPYLCENYCTTTNNIHFKLKKDVESISLTYIYTYLMYNIELLERCFTGSPKPKISQDSIKTIPIPVPSLEVQEQTVQELSDIEQSINTIKTRIDQLKREKDMYMKHGRTAEIRELLKDCEMKTLGEVCSFLNGYAFSSSDYEKEGVPLLKIQNIGTNVFTHYIKENEKYKKFKVQKDDILIALSGATVGKIGVYNYEKFAYLNQRVAKLICNESCKDFVYYSIVFNGIQKRIVEKATGAGQPNISTNTIGDLPIQWPNADIKEQCISIFKDKEAYLNKLQTKIEKEKEYIEELKKLGKDVIASYCS